MEIAMTLFLYAIVLIDLISICKKKDKRINTTYIVIFTFSFAIIILYYLGVSIPSPSIEIQKLITSVTK